MSKPSTVKEAANERVFDVIIYVIAAIIIVIVLYPLIFIVSASFSDPTRVLNGEVWCAERRNAGCLHQYFAKRKDLDGISQHDYLYGRRHSDQYHHDDFGGLPAIKA